MARPRRHDPERRERIVDAALRVVARRGITGLSHRTAAAEADVPLGSTTYHFASLDELLVAALRKACEGFGRRLRAHPSLADPAAGLAPALAGLLAEWLDGARAGTELEYELYLAALRRPALRPVAAEWTEAVAAVLARRTDPATARAAIALMDGICLQVLLTGGRYDEGYAREMLARVLREDPPAAGRGAAGDRGAGGPEEGPNPTAGGSSQPPEERTDS
ncbi:TetR/AcrR family transcriptional regulator [Streptomyces sp. NPDC058855]|uniref:TetR/AcrR family transcriptional regulator n=1 Tax=Streptomyces sp. NPDC058855 TaxID=3346651 RepID=UPI0036A24F63